MSGKMTTRHIVQVLAFVGALAFATVSLRASSPYLLSDALRLGATLAFLGIALVLSRYPAAQRWGSASWSRLRAMPRRVVTALALLELGAALFIYRFVLEPIPHVSDEVGYLFQARVFAAGHLSLAAPPLAQFFPAEWVTTHDGRWFAIFPPGWPLILSLGVRLGVPWLVNPVLGALGVVTIYALAKELLFQVRGTARQRLGPFAASGALGALSLLVRPLDALALWVVAAAYLLSRQRTRRQLAGTGVSAGGLAVGAVAYVIYNRALTGRWFQAPLSLAMSCRQLGFGDGVGPHGHDLLNAALNLNFNLAVLSADLFGWPISSLCLAIALLVFGRLAWPHRLAALLAGAILGSYLLFWYHGVCFGARLTFSALPFLLILTVEGAQQATEWWGAGTGQAADPDRAPAVGRARVKVFLVLCFAFCALVYLPVVSLLRPYHHLRQVDRGLSRFVATHVAGAAIVFVGPNPWDYGAALLENALDPRAGRVLYAVESGAADAQLVGQFPGRSVYHYVHRSEPDRPLSPSLEKLLWGGHLSDLLSGMALGLCHR